MLARQTVRAMRTATQTRGVTSLVNKPSHVAENQKLFTSSHKETYQKRDSDKVILSVLFGGFAFGMVQLVRGEVCMATGKGKNE